MSGLIPAPSKLRSENPCKKPRVTNIILWYAMSQQIRLKRQNGTPQDCDNEEFIRAKNI